MHAVMTCDATKQHTPIGEKIHKVKHIFMGFLNLQLATPRNTHCDDLQHNLSAPKISDSVCVAWSCNVYTGLKL